MNEAGIWAPKPRGGNYMVVIGDGPIIRVRTTGRKTFIIRCKHTDKTRAITLAPDWPALSIKDSIHRAATAKTPSDATVNDLLKEYHAAVISRHARPTQFVAYEQRISNALGNIRVSEVAAKRVADLVTEHSGTPRSADSLRSHLKAIFSLAIELGWREDNPAAVIGARVTGYTYEPRTRVLSHDEIREIWAWEGNNAASVRFLLPTGIRISEGQNGRADGDFWRMAKPKNDKPH